MRTQCLENPIVYIALNKSYATIRFEKLKFSEEDKIRIRNTHWLEWIKDFVGNRPRFFLMADFDEGDFNLFIDFLKNYTNDIRIRPDFFSKDPYLKGDKAETFMNDICKSFLGKENLANSKLSNIPSNIQISMPMRDPNYICEFESILDLLRYPFWTDVAISFDNGNSYIYPVLDAKATDEAKGLLKIMKPYKVPLDAAKLIKVCEFECEIIVIFEKREDYFSRKYLI